MGSSSLQALLALAAVALWSTNAWAAAVALDAMSVGWLLLVQYGVAAAAFLAVRLARRGKPVRTCGALTRPAIGLGVVGEAPLLVVGWGSPAGRGFAVR